MSVDAEWLQSYATARHDWNGITQNGKQLFVRRIGIVESMFDVDGTDFEGRADLTIHLHIEVRTSSTIDTLRDRLLEAWAILRQEHVLLSTKVTEATSIVPSDPAYTHQDRVFVFEPASNVEDMRSSARDHIVFVDDFYHDVNPEEFFIHALNSGRCINASEALSKIYVMPMKLDKEGFCQLHLVVIAAHQISDGLSFQRWMANLIDLINLPPKQLRSYAKRLCSATPLSRLPPAQESLYPPVQGNRAKQRWFWLLARILRHTRISPPASFQNPLRRRNPLPSALAFQPKFSKVLDYTNVPPLNGFRVRAELNAGSTRKLADICRQAKISIGSGCFALVAMAMMLFEEKRNPHVPMEQRRPFVGSFPINPRPFLTAKATTGREDSLILAFSDGITLPHLPSHLDFQGRLRLLGKQASRQLRQYQKRPRKPEEEIQMGSKSPSQLFPLLYLSTIERLGAKATGDRRHGWNIQGNYPAKRSATLSTCGVSSVGARSSVISSGRYNTQELPRSDKINADFRNLSTTVRARDGEFLVGVVGDTDCIRFQASYDGCAIDPELAEEWKTWIETVLDPEEVPSAKL
ncbi:hypothetical protein H2204_003331 [Knufia peltigerae]|uniref:Uncharacterized protein n=1 Tax=Knufia peltigerae TaxID=1002370 RepID=A0AA38Y9R0_9EURO|nr:hypothetical protein H2204_003331 [Knufia peltigerae]